MDLQQATEIALNSLKATVIFSAAYAGFVFGLPAIAGNRSRKINTHQELEEIVAEEAERLGIEFDISPRFHNSISGIKCNGEGYELFINPYDTAVDVRYQLYIIAMDEPSDRGIPWPVYLLVSQPRAVLYACTGIRL